LKGAHHGIERIQTRNRLPRPDGAHCRGIRAGLARAPAGERGSAQRPVHRARRHRLRSVGCYGSPIRTPNLDKLAKNDLLYTNMHTTALCSPSRSCMLTGRNHHSNAMACITEGSEGYPGSNGAIPFENGFLSEMLLGHGYNTYCIGKWHLTPAEQISAAGPYERWPLGRGFERYYGFLGGDTSQYYPRTAGRGTGRHCHCPARRDRSRGTVVRAPYLRPKTRCRPTARRRATG